MRSLAGSSVLILVALLLSISLTHAQDTQGDIYVEANIDNLSPYVGQQIIYNFKLYDAVGFTNPLYQPSDFEGFWRIDIGVVSQTTEQINGRRYSVTTIATALYPTHSGSIIIQPSSVVLPETGFRVEQILTANLVSLEIQNLPEGKPSNFNGAVGQFTMSATLDRQVVNVGEPVTMTVTVSGTGNVEQLPPPAVPDYWRSTINAGNYRSQIQNGLLIGTRDYQIIFIPASSGSQELPSITLDYFDPVSTNYKLLSTSLIPIQVSGDALTSPNSSDDYFEPSLRLKPIESLTPIETNPLSMIIAALLPLLIVLVAGYQKRLKTRKAQLSVKLRQQRALQGAIRSLKVMSLADTKAGYQVVDDVFKRYVADKLEMELHVVKQSDLIQLLILNKVSESAVSRVQKFVSDVEAGKFSALSDNITLQRRDQMTKFLRDIDTEWVVR